MLKHKDIIEKLTAEQKIALLTDTREALGEAVKELNIPTIAINDLWEENVTDQREIIFPSAKSLANSWDPTLAGETAKCLATIGASRGDNLFILPSPSATSSVYGRELSEEPYLSSEIVGGMAKRLSAHNASYCLREPVCKAEDIRFLDKEPHMPALFDRMARPFKSVLAQGGACAVLLENDKPQGAYEVANDAMQKYALPQGMEKLVKIEDSDMTTAALTSGKQLIGGSSLVISTALENYRRIYRSMEEGGATAQELNMTLADGAAISEEIIDMALDRKLQLASKCASGFAPVSESDIKAQAYKSASESIVLVKNTNRALPLNKNEALSIIGDIISDGEETKFLGFKDKLLSAISTSRCSVMGFERGYSLSDNVSPELIEGACKIASSGTTAIAFVGMGATREARMPINARLTLPGNQIAMLTKLRAVAKKLIVVVAGECLPDMSFDSLADAILLIPSQGAYVANALWDILSGEKNPGGRLACAGYSGVDTSTRELQKRKSKNKQTIGPFIGYRYLDSNGEKTKYPVGYGLSYTTFEYSRIQVDRTGTVTLTVRNAGKYDGYDVVQIYAGMLSSKRIRPRRELKGAVKVFLRAGERTTVTCQLKDLEIFNTDGGKFVLESGGYDVYVSSAFGIDYAKKRINISGAKLVKEDKRLSDYLQNVSNIVSEGYTMEAYCKPMNLKSKLKTFGAILFITTLFADIIYAISCFMLEIPFDDPDYLTIFSVINAVCLIGSILSIIIGNAGIKRRKRIVEKQEMKATRDLFKTVKPTDARTIDQLFEDEFDISLDAVESKEIVYNEKDESTYTFMAVDTDIPTLAKELEEHFLEYGLSITPKMARKMLSAVMTSRLLIVRNAMGISCERITEILARFFGTEPHGESLNGQEWNRHTLLRKGDGDNNYAPLMQAINSAINEGDKACFYSLSNVQLKDLGNMLMPYVQYFGNPDVEHSVIDEGGTITLPSNLWFVVGPGKNESLDNIPAFVANLATLVDVEAQTAKEASVKTVRKTVSCHQLDALIFRAKKNSDINENLWKGVDTLEAFVNEKTPYHIGNKLFLQMEKYLAIYNACEADLNDAMDCVVAGKLLPAILNLLKNNDNMQDTDLAQIVESIFGEEYATNCRNTIKRLVISKASEKQVTEEKKEEVKAEPAKEANPIEAKAEETPEEQRSAEEVVEKDQPEEEGEAQDPKSVEEETKEQGDEGNAE